MSASSVVSLVRPVEAREWRARFQGALRTATDPEGLHQELVDGLKRRAWTQLKDSRGKTFASFDAFCRCPAPAGLGTEPDLIRDFLDGLIGRRRAKLLLVPPSIQGRRGEALPAPGGERSRQDERLRAIAERAPEVVSELYVQGLLTAKEAEKFGRLHKPPQLRKAIQRFVRVHSKTLENLHSASPRAVRAQLKADVAELFEEHGQPDLIYSAMQGINADLFPSVLALHVPQGSTVADVTYGKGAFWKHVPSGAYKVLATDLQQGVDLRKLPYESHSIDAVVIDPPYMHISGGGSTTAGRDLERRYRNLGRGTQGHEAVLRLYIEGAEEAQRVLKKRGTLIIKCQDEVANGQRLTHVEIIQAYGELGMKCIDLFVLVQHGKPVVNSKLKKQRHARKNHSYFLVFKTGGAIQKLKYAERPWRVTL